MFATSSLSPPATLSNQVLLCAAQTMFGKEGAHDLALSQESCGRPRGARPGDAAVQVPSWSQGPYYPEASMSSTIFGLQSSYMLGYSGLFTLFLRRSARCFTHVPGEVDYTPTYLTAILIPKCVLYFMKKTKWGFWPTQYLLNTSNV